jgi:phosphinothricin acetyltransferase
MTSNRARDAAAAEPVEVAPLGAHHWDDVRRIYVEGLATGQASFETSAPDWLAWDAGHLPQSRLVAARNARIIGWAALSPVSRRQVYAGVAEVSVYVARQAHGQGIGRLLLDRLIASSERAGIWTLQASIFPENAASVRLHETRGFRLVGRRERIAQHHGVWRDTVIYERRSSVVGV